MATIRNKSGIDLIVPWLGDRLVLSGQRVEVPDEDVYAYTQQEATWEAVDDSAKSLTDEGAAQAEAAANGTATTAAAEPPPGNASRDEWAAYVTGRGLATPDELEGRGRDSLRDEYGPPDAPAPRRRGRQPEPEAEAAPVIPDLEDAPPTEPEPVTAEPTTDTSSTDTPQEG